MEDELLTEIRAIAAGDITDPQRCRRVFREASDILAVKLGELYAQQDALRDAKEAFLEGWPKRQLRAMG